MPPNGPKRTKLNPKMDSYNITFTKKWFFKCDQVQGGCQGFRGLVAIKKPLFGKSYVIQIHFWVHFGPKRTKLDPNFVHLGAYWMFISMVKIILEIILHKNCHRNQIMAISCLKTSFLGPENQFFSIFEKNFPQDFFKNFFAELQICQKLV